MTMTATLVFATNYRQFKRWLYANELTEQDHVYISEPHQMFGWGRETPVVILNEIHSETNDRIYLMQCEAKSRFENITWGVT